MPLVLVIAPGLDKGDHLAHHRCEARRSVLRAYPHGRFFQLFRGRAQRDEILHPAKAGQAVGAAGATIYGGEEFERDEHDGCVLRLCQHSQPYERFFELTAFHVAILYCLFRTIIRSLSACVWMNHSLAVARCPCVPIPGSLLFSPMPENPDLDPRLAERQATWAAEQARGEALLEAILPSLADGNPHLPTGDTQQRLQFLGDVLWCVFSNNADVVSPTGEVCSLGSWRGTGGTLACALAPYGYVGEYLDFYMASLYYHPYGLARACAREVFSALHALGYDWRVGYRVKRAPVSDEAAEAALAARDAALEAHRAQYPDYFVLDRDTEAARAHSALLAAHPLPLSPEVAAYHDVYGHMPEQASYAT